MVSKTKDNILTEYIIEETKRKVGVHTQEILDKWDTDWDKLVVWFDLLLCGKWLKDAMRN